MKLLDAVTPNDDKKNDTKLINHAATRRRLKKKEQKENGDLTWSISINLHKMAPRPIRLAFVCKRDVYLETALQNLHVLAAYN
jgi:hypothetical protein